MFGKPKLPKTFLALDVGTEVVKALVSIIEADNVQVIGASKKRQSFSAMKGGVVANLRSVVAVCQDAINEATENTERPAKVIMGIAGELVKGIIVEATYSREVPEAHITQDEMLSIVEKAKEEAVDESKKVYAPYFATRQATDEIVEVGAVVAGVKIDGFHVDDAVGLQGKQVDIKIFYTFAPRLHVGYLQSLADNLKLELAAILPEPYAVVRAMREANEETFSAVIVDVGGGTTDIAVVKKGLLVGTEMVAFGGRVFTKRVAQELMINHEEAENLKIKYSNRELVEAKVPEVREAIRKDVPIWLDSFEIALSEYSDVVKVFPDRLLLCGGGSLLPEIKSALVEYPWVQRLAYERPPKISHILPEHLHGVIDKTALMVKTEDVTPLALARFGLEIDGLVDK
jgi:cell division protein FtsA